MRRSLALLEDYAKVALLVRRCEHGPLKEPELAAALRLAEERVWRAVDYGMRAGLLRHNEIGEVVETDLAKLGQLIAELEDR